VPARKWKSSNHILAKEDPTIPELTSVGKIGHIGHIVKVWPGEKVMLASNTGWLAVR
jgi:hypothetical protein